MQIKKESLERLVDRLNRITNSPNVPWSKNAKGEYKANIGCYHLDWAYGGVKLVRMGNEGGGLSDGDVLAIGFATKRECYHALHAFIRGIEAVEKKDET